jgi:hypothetical protein
LTAFSFARIRFFSVTRRSANRPRLSFAQMCVKPRNANVSGLPRPRFCRTFGGEPAALDQAGLLDSQLQVELREPVAQP